MSVLRTQTDYILQSTVIARIRREIAQRDINEISDLAESRSKLGRVTLSQSLCSAVGFLVLETDRGKANSRIEEKSSIPGRPDSDQD